MPLINCKVGLKLKWTKSCVLAAAGVDNADAYSNNFIFVVKGTKLCIPAVTLSAKDHQKLSKLHSKRFERSVYWNEYRTKSKNKNMAHQYRYLLKSNCVGVNRFFFLLLFIQIKMTILKRLKFEVITYQKIIFINLIINGKN